MSTIDNAEPVLRAESVTKHFPVHGRNMRDVTQQRRVVHAVDDVSFELYADSVLALVGESGSGKTTVGQVVAQLEPATSGRVIYEGKHSRFTKGAALHYRRYVQLTFQDPYASLNPIHNVGYHLERPLRIHHLVKSRAEARQEALRLLQQVHLTPAEHIIDKLPHELSGGQRQRVAIARALAVRPRVLVADEPVSMLDVSVRLSVLNLLSELVHTTGLALLYITHDIASARYFADRVLVMYAGQVLEGGPAEELTQSPLHPYTQLLISAAPDPGSAGQTERVIHAPGEAPSLIEPPTGCRFHPRCPHAMPICKQQTPPKFSVQQNRWAACWLYDSEKFNGTPTPETLNKPPSASPRLLNSSDAAEGQQNREQDNA